MPVSVHSGQDCEDKLSSALAELAGIAGRLGLGIICSFALSPAWPLGGKWAAGSFRNHKQDLSSIPILMCFLHVVLAQQTSSPVVQGISACQERERERTRTRHKPCCLLWLRLGGYVASFPLFIISEFLSLDHIQGKANLTSAISHKKDLVDMFFFFFPFPFFCILFDFYWGIMALQCCVSFCHTMKWISYLLFSC